MERKIDKFSFEDLEVWQAAVVFAKDILDISDQLRRKGSHYRLVEQLESSSASVAANIAEGKGRFSKKEFIQYLFIARGSLFETMTFIEILKMKEFVGAAEYHEIKKKSCQLGRMISALIKSLKKTI